MRKVAFYGFMMAVVACVLGSCSVDFKRKQLPNAALSFVVTYFPTAEVDSIGKSLDKDYSVVLNSGVELEFNSKGDWSEINLKKNDFPESMKEILPEKMMEYLTVNYPESKIRKIEKTYPGSKNFGYRIRLNKPNNMELSFLKNGELSMNAPSEMKLPSMASQFLSKYFSEEKISFIEQDQNRNYIVYMDNGTQVSFERKGNWDELNARKKSLPESVADLLPSAAKDYLNQNHKGQMIQKIEKKSYGFRIRLGKPNEIYLSFSRSGSVIEDEMME